MPRQFDFLPPAGELAIVRGRDAELSVLYITSTVPTPLPRMGDGTPIFVDERHDPAEFAAGAEVPEGLHLAWDEAYQLLGGMATDHADREYRPGRQGEPRSRYTARIFERILQDALGDPSVDLRLIAGRRRDSGADTLLFGFTSDLDDPFGR